MGTDAATESLFSIDQVVDLAMEWMGEAKLNVVKKNIGEGKIRIEGTPPKIEGSFTDRAIGYLFNQRLVYEFLPNGTVIAPDPSKYRNGRLARQAVVRDIRLLLEEGLGLNYDPKARKYVPIQTSPA